jgi:hypothetical protein
MNTSLILTVSFRGDKIQNKWPKSILLSVLTHYNPQINISADWDYRAYI